jgi:DNA-binding transcriptional regulator YdaS (Cro superfamily)
MLLKAYLEQEKIKINKFAKSIGMATGTIYKITCNSRKPTIKQALMIEQGTKGAVSRGELLWPESFSEKLPCGSEQMRFAPKSEEQ